MFAFTLAFNYLIDFEAPFTHIVSRKKDKWPNSVKIARVVVVVPALDAWRVVSCANGRCESE